LYYPASLLFYDIASIKCRPIQLRGYLEGYRTGK
jgi:hypothetical protein